MSKRVIWVWVCEKNGDVLFHGNLNPGCPPYHMGDISNLLMGENIVWGYAKWELENEFCKKAWRQKFPTIKIKPKKIVIGFEPYKKAR